MKWLMLTWVAGHFLVGIRFWFLAKREAPELSLILYFPCKQNQLPLANIWLLVAIVIASTRPSYYKIDELY